MRNDEQEIRTSAFVFTFIIHHSTFIIWIPMLLIRKIPFRGQSRPAPPIAPPAPPALVLVGVSNLFFDGTDGGFIAEFDVHPGQSLLDTSGADPAKWTCRVSGTGYSGTEIDLLDGSHLQINFAGAGSQAGPDVVSYANNPSDIADTEARQLPAFADFPI
jgi:hypothetical protein